MVNDNIVNDVNKYLGTYAKCQLAERFNNRYKYNDPIIVAKAVDSYFEHDDYRYINDLIAKVKVAFGREIDKEDLIKRCNEYIVWAFNTDVDLFDWCKRYDAVYDGMFGCINQVDYTDCICRYDTDEKDYYVGNLNDENIA